MLRTQTNQSKYVPPFLPSNTQLPLVEIGKVLDSTKGASKDEIMSDIQMLRGNIFNVG